MKKFLFVIILFGQSTVFSQVNNFSITGWYYGKGNGYRYNVGLGLGFTTKRSWIKNTIDLNSVNSDYGFGSSLKNLNSLSLGKELCYTKGYFIASMNPKSGVYYYHSVSSDFYLRSIGIHLTIAPEIGLNFNRFSVKGGLNIMLLFGTRYARVNGGLDPTNAGYLFDYFGSSYLRVAFALKPLNP